MYYTDQIHVLDVYEFNHDQENNPFLSSEWMQWFVYLLV